MGGPPNAQLSLGQTGPLGAAKPTWEDKPKVRLEEKMNGALTLLPSLVGGLAGRAAPLLFELTRPLNHLFIESELQEAFQVQESWSKPGAAVYLWVGWVSTCFFSPF